MYAVNPVIANTSGYVPKLAKADKLSFREWLKLHWNRYLLTNLGRIHRSIKTNIFSKAKVIFPTQNLLKVNAVRDLILFNRQPISSKETIKERERLGLAAFKDSLTLDPIGKGICLGGVVHFFQKSFDSNPTKAAQDFTGGMPLEALITQMTYLNVGPIFGIAQLSNLIIQTIENPNNPNLKAQYEDFEELRVLYVAIKEYIAEEHTSYQDFPNVIEDKLLKKGFSLAKFGEKVAPKFRKEANEKIPKNYIRVKMSSFRPIIYTTLREVADHFIKENRALTQTDWVRFAFNIKGMDIERIVCLNSRTENILSELQSLDPGYYSLHLPILNTQDEIITFHCTGLIIENDNSCILFDPNFAIGKLDRINLRRAMQNMFKEYSNIPTKKKTNLFTQIKNNLLRRHSIPSTRQTDPPSGYSICKIRRVYGVAPHLNRTT